MPAVKDLTSAAQKWSRNAGAAATEFAANAQGAADKWGRNTQASGGNFRQAISAGNIQAKFERGVSKAAQLGKFARKLASVGAGRYSEGVGGAQQDWSTGFEPYHGVLQTISLPPRAPRGDARNYERVKAVGQALNAKRIAGLGA
jgi:hypothetical protein